MRPPICDKTAPPHLENPGSATADSPPPPRDSLVTRNNRTFSGKGGSRECLIGDANSWNYSVVEPREAQNVINFMRFFLENLAKSSVGAPPKRNPGSAPVIVTIFIYFNVWEWILEFGLPVIVFVCNRPVRKQTKVVFSQVFVCSQGGSGLLAGDGLPGRGRGGGQPSDAEHRSTKANSGSTCIE